MKYKLAFPRKFSIKILMGKYKPYDKNVIIQSFLLYRVILHFSYENVSDTFRQYRQYTLSIALEVLITMVDILWQYWIILYL